MLFVTGTKSNHHDYLCQSSCHCRPSGCPQTDSSSSRVMSLVFALTGALDATRHVLARAPPVKDPEANRQRWSMFRVLPHSVGPWTTRIRKHFGRVCRSRRSNAGAMPLAALLHHSSAKFSGKASVFWLIRLITKFLDYRLIRAVTLFRLNSQQAKFRW